MLKITNILRYQGPHPSPSAAVATGIPLIRSRQQATSIFFLFLPVFYYFSPSARKKCSDKEISMLPTHV